MDSEDGSSISVSNALQRSAWYVLDAFSLASRTWQLTMKNILGQIGRKMVLTLKSAVQLLSITRAGLISSLICTGKCQVMLQKPPQPRFHSLALWLQLQDVFTSIDLAKERRKIFCLWWLTARSWVSRWFSHLLSWMSREELPTELP